MSEQSEGREAKSSTSITRAANEKGRQTALGLSRSTVVKPQKSEKSCMH